MEWVTKSTFSVPQALIAAGTVLRASFSTVASVDG